MEELIGSLLQDRYRITELLGRQTGRRTYLATDTQTETAVVIKLLLFGPDFTWDDLKLFEREAEVLKSLDHPDIPRYLDFFEVELERGKGFALVQSYIPAKSLQQWIQAGRTFSEEDLKAIGKDLLSILEYLHNRNPSVVHRDIKPSNILLTDRTAHSPGQVYLIDFGSVQTAIKGGTRTIVGTYGYMPPEQFGGITTPAADIYALGVTLIYLASGSPPDELPQKDLRIQFEDRVNLSPPLVQWLRKATAPEVEKRWRSAHSALQSLQVSHQSPTLARFWEGHDRISDRPNQPNLVREKPFGSKVKLRKASNGIEIMIPPQGFHLGLVPIAGFTIAWNSFLAVWYGSAISMFFTGGWFMALFGVLHLGVGVSLLGTIIFTLFGYTRLRIDESRISLSYEIFNAFRFMPKKAPVQHVIKLELAPISYKQNSEGSNVVVSPQINLWIGTKQISFGGSDRLTQPELEWIASELSDYLALPVTTPHHLSETTQILWRDRD
jgi:serine/threonine protein kinase